MSKPIKLENSELLVELSEQEQETVVGGFDLGNLFGFFFFDQTEIDTSASHAVSFPLKTSHVSSLSNTNYSLRRTSLVFGIPMSRSNRRSFSSFNRLLRRIFSRFW
ncbi:hypothetical protein NIES593_16460 [Hydrococcus rivularis NIES-593]|uniref:Uncharacterized protein n=1 Tax=Hydrococcus rivularis NIES-593 TaxID=1921803 RepID=A0A1U7HC89_9CYAN|nr:hypothetical protein [Hydrococcus rivularis]OKH21207.1 hypothetical protein NIES593_16460 [Hydrococcus rivularis NIES-593]